MSSHHSHQSPPYRLGLHIFRRDLRLSDNTALIAALNECDRVLPCFIFDKRQIEKNEYKSNHCIQFMVQSLQELDEELKKNKSKLYLFYGMAEEIVEQCIMQLKIDAVFINRDYTPFSRERDANIEKICLRNGISFHYYADALLQEPEAVLKPDQTPYTVFTHSFNKSRQILVKEPQKNHHSNYYNGSIKLENTPVLEKLLKINNPDLYVKGGRKEALALLKNMTEISNYNEQRNYPALDKTTRLSAHNKFGTLSIREFYTAITKSFGKNHGLITELYWRDFFTHIAFYYPHVFGKAFRPKYENLQWSQNEEHYKAWCEGQTGFPIVDAGMRQLNKTGYMHNRVRMIVASFLSKDLHIDWRLGEKYFAKQLVDYDPSVNNGNWQWSASTGCDAQPYFRIFNPWLQQLKYDADCLYIKRYVPELAGLDPRIIHAFDKKPANHAVQYPVPLVNHQVESHISKKMFSAE